MCSCALPVANVDLAPQIDDNQKRGATVEHFDSPLPVKRAKARNRRKPQVANVALSPQKKDVQFHSRALVHEPKMEMKKCVVVLNRISTSKSQETSSPKVEFKLKQCAVVLNRILAPDQVNQNYEIKQNKPTRKRKSAMDRFEPPLLVKRTKRVLRCKK